MKITIRCGVFDGGKPHGKELGAIKRQDLDLAEGRVTFDRLRWEERLYKCPDHGAMQIHDEYALDAASEVNGWRCGIEARRSSSSVALPLGRVSSPIQLGHFPPQEAGAPQGVTPSLPLGLRPSSPPVEGCVAMRLSNEDDLREGPEPLSSGRPSLPMHPKRPGQGHGRTRQLFLSLLSWERAVPNVTRA